MRADTSIGISPSAIWRRAALLTGVVAGLALAGHEWMEMPQRATPGPFAPPALLAAKSSPSPQATALPRQKAVRPAGSRPSLSPITPIHSIDSVVEETQYVRALAEDPNEIALPQGEIFEEEDPRLIEDRQVARIAAMQLELGGLVQAQAVDRDFREQAHAVVERAVEQLAATGVRLNASDCRSTLCQLDFVAADDDATNEFLNQFAKLLQWNTDIRFITQKQVDGVAITMFVTRDGERMPVLVSEQPSS